MRIAGVKKHSSVNGPGVRYVIFFQGCIHHCRQCQNPETWDRSGGEEKDTAEVISEMLETRYLDGITLSGGDPLLQPEAAAEIARAAKEKGLNVWAYTGWTWEQLMNQEAGQEVSEALKYIDVLVDGKFMQELKSNDVIWRGSSNQRLIWAARSLEEGKVLTLKGKEEQWLM